MRVLILLLSVTMPLSLNAEETPASFDKGINELLLNDDITGSAFLADTEPNCSYLMITSWCFSLENTMIKIDHHPGDNRYSISEIEISVLNDKKWPKFPTKLNFISSTKGIRLGITQSKLIAILGEPIRNSDERIEYKLDNNAFILKEYNMPIYFGDYYFKKGKLVKFKYGFGYP